MPTSSFHRRRLPHWYVEGASYFITYTVKGAVPKAMIQKAADAKDLIVVDGEGTCRITVKTPAFLRHLLDYLARHQDAPEMLLTNDTYALVVAQSLMWFHDQGEVRLLAFCIMGNHVHVVLDSVEHDPSNFMKRHKTFTANEIRKLRGREGGVWQREFWDYRPRHEKALLEKIRYTLLNPVTAGLVKRISEYGFTWWNTDVVSVCGNKVEWVVSAR